MKRILILLLLPVLLMVSTSCAEKNLEITPEEATAVLKDLVPRSYELNVIFFGEGLPVEDPPETKPATVTYRPVTADCGYTSIAQIMRAAEQVYSKRYLDGVYVSAFIGVAAESEDGMLDTTVSPRYQEIGGKLQADTAASVKDIRGKLEVLSVTLGKATPTYVATEATCRDGEGNTVVMTVLLTLENGVWLLDSPTY